MQFLNKTKAFKDDSLRSKDIFGDLGIWKGRVPDEVWKLGAKEGSWDKHELPSFAFFFFQDDGVEGTNSNLTW